MSARPYRYAMVGPLTPADAKGGGGGGGDARKSSLLVDAFGPARPASEFKNMTLEERVLQINMSRVGQRTTLVLQGLIMALWMMALIVPGFALFDGTPGALNAYTHAGWWMLVECIIMGAGWACTKFSLRYDAATSRVEFSAADAVELVNAYRWMLVFGTGMHLVHFVLTMFELSDARSTLYVNYRWCMIAFIVFLVLEAGLSAWQVSRARKYYYDVWNALTAGKEGANLFTMYLDDDNDDDDSDAATEPDVETPPASESTPSVKGRIVHQYYRTRK